MCCVEDQETFDISQKVIAEEVLPDLGPSVKLISKYPYCISLGDLDEEKKANLEDEEVRSAQELYESYRAEEVEYPVAKEITYDDDNEMLEENVNGEVKHVFNSAA